MKPMARVTWIDAQDHMEPWVLDVDAESFGDVDCVIVSLGFIVKQTEKYLTLAGDWNEVASGRGDYGRVTKIPMRWVQGIEILSPPSLLLVTAL